MRLFILIFILQVMNVFVNLFGRAGNFSIKDGESNLRGRSSTDRSHRYSFHFTSFHFTSFHFTWVFLEPREGRSVIPARSPHLLVDNPVRLLWVIFNAFSVSSFTLLYPEEIFKIPAFQVMNKCS
jgi:hypothetical protein